MEILQRQTRDGQTRDTKRIIKAVKKLDGVKIVLENAGDAKEAIDLILRKTKLIKETQGGIHPSDWC